MDISISLLDDDQFNQIVYEWNRTEAEYPAERTVVDLFEEQAAKTPDRIAVVYEGRRLSYGELNEGANRLARYLRGKYGIGAEDLVALCVERSEYMVIGILGIMKAGGAYVPISPEYPDERIGYIVKDTGAKVVLIDEGYRERVKVVAGEGVGVEGIDAGLFWEGLGGIRGDDLPRQAGPLNLAYVIYTSGTTGQPKGVMIEHRGLVNRLYWMNSQYPLRETDKVVQKTAYTFDVSVWELTWAILYGAQIVFARPGGHKDSEYLAELIGREGITVIHFVPSMLSVFEETVGGDDRLERSCESLRYIFCSGEALTVEQVKEGRRIFGGAEIHNLYGPTEASIDVLYYDCNRGGLEEVLIGRPIYNTTAYILDEGKKPLPVGAVGELYIGGEGVARGYLNKAELTAEKFVENPYQSEEEKKRGYNGVLYRTGDLARYLADGNIEYLGRNDFQVKLRGFRIELGEIESKVVGYEGVKQCVVVVKERGGSKYLAAYYTGEGEIGEEGLRAYLCGVLPEYMVPAAYKRLEELPLTVNGKLDRRALPEIEIKDEPVYEGPADGEEKELCRIFAGVLGLEAEKVSVGVDFFRMGGNSIMAIKLANRIQRELGVGVRVADIFTHKSVRNLAAYMKGLEDTWPGIEAFAFGSAEEQVLSYAQERLWFLDNYEGGNSVYTIPVVGELREDAAPGSVKKAIEEIVRRHEVLRSVIRMGKDGEGYQEAIDGEEMPFEIPEREIEAGEKFEAAIREEINHPFMLNREYPIRAVLWREIGTGGKRYLSVVVHHIAFDGWSQELFIKELVSLYRYYEDGGIYPLEKPAIQYKDYAKWQREYLGSGVMEKQLRYWKEKLGGYEALNLITDKERPGYIRYEGDDAAFEFDKETSVLIKDTAKELGVSVYAVLLSAYYLLLSTYSNQKDIVVGTVIANRQYPGVSGMIGFFVNTLALRHRIDGKQRAAEYIQTIGNMAAEAQEYQDMPFERLVEELGVEKDTSRSPVFQALFSVQNFEQGDEDARGIIFKDIYGLGEQDYYKVAKFDISLLLEEAGERIGGIFNYAVSLFERGTIEGYIETYREIVKRLVQRTAGSVDELRILSEETYRRIVYEWNGTEAEYPADKTIGELFEEQAAETPDRIAVVYEGKRLNYRELNEAANRLARYLRREYGIGPDGLVALCIDRSELMPVMILGVLKAGGAYVPISPEYPDARIRYILKDTGAKVVLANRVYREKIRGLAGEGVGVESIDGEGFRERMDREPAGNPGRRSGPEDLAYVMYTSGTTGEPKGVMVEQRGVVNLLTCLYKAYGFIPGTEVVLFVANYIFDISVEQLFFPLLNGDTLLVVKNTFWREEGIIQYLQEEKVTYINMTPSLLGQMEVEDIASLKQLSSGGEALSEELWKRLAGKHFSFGNSYGPTETTIWSTVNIGGKSNHIGRPIGNTSCYILDDSMRPLPVGAIGELYIGGVGVARGYLNKPELTAEKFVENPYQSEEEKKRGYNGVLYRTGDLVRYLGDGNIEYLGRNDFQVKLRGFRIELGEIEGALLGYPGVKQGVVAAREQKGGGKYLAAYYVGDGDIEEGSLQKYLEGKLPEYMVPGVYKRLEGLPLTASGKLDRRALPEVEFEKEEGYEGPRDEREAGVAKVFAEVLGMEEEEISVTANFFRLGGNSIMAIKLANRIQRELGVGVRVADIFTHRSVRNLAAYMKGLKDTWPRIEALAFGSAEEQALSYAQGRLWFLETYEGGSNAYNIPMVREIAVGVDVESLKVSIREIVRRHEVLHSVIKTGKDGEAYQEAIEIRDWPFEIGVEYADGLQTLQEKIKAEVNHLFKLDREYPIRVKLYAKDNERYISVVVHHIAFDGWSWEVFFEELIKLYKYFTGGCKDTYPLEDLELQYKDYAVWQRGYLKDEILEQQIRYWTDRLSGYETLSLATDKMRPLYMTYEGADIAFGFDKETCGRIHDAAKELGVSVYTLLLSAYYLLLSTYSNQKDIVLGTVMANRQYSEIGGLIGFFANTLALRYKIDDEHDSDVFIRGIGEMVADAQKYQDVPFDMLVDKLGIEKDTSRSPVFQAMFTLQDLRYDRKELDSLFKEARGIGSEFTAAKFDLTLTIEESWDSISGVFNYSLALFERETIESYIETYIEIVHQLVQKKENAI